MSLFFMQFSMLLDWTFLLCVIHLDHLSKFSLGLSDVLKLTMWFCIMEITLRHSFTDFTLEAKNSERTANCFRKKSVIKVPYVFWVWALWNLSCFLCLAFLKHKLIELLNQLLAVKSCCVKHTLTPQNMHSHTRKITNSQQEHEPDNQYVENVWGVTYAFTF